MKDEKKMGKKEGGKAGEDEDKRNEEEREFLAWVDKNAPLRKRASALATDSAAGTTSKRV